MEFSPLEKSILRAISYFDLFDYPLTLVEIHRSLDRPAEFSEIRRVLTGRLSEFLEFSGGCWFFQGRRELLAERRRRYLLADKKYRRALKIAGLLKFFPFIRSLAVSGSLSYGNASLESDIDFFLIAAPGRIWTARFLTVGFLKLFRLRPSPKAKRDKICPSFFAAENCLDLRAISHYRQSRHFSYWISQFKFLFGRPEDFFRANGWLKEIFPNFYPPEDSGRRKIKETFFSQGVKKAGEFIFSGKIWEKFFQRIQLAVMPAEYRRAAAGDSEVILSDCFIKIHLNPKGRSYDRQWSARLAEFNFNGFEK